MYIYIILFISCCAFLTCETNENKTFTTLFYDEDVIESLDSMQIIRAFGYPAEAHEVLTADGYLLQLHRIPHAKNTNKTSETKNIKNFPVLIQHGLLGTSADFLLIGPEQGLPFLLADMGFDVWLGNFRGNTYSRGSVKFTPNEREFWDFTWHESGIYDLPAQIDFIRELTQNDKIIYIGISMGTTTFFVLTSELPEYNDKIVVSHLMAPIAYTAHIRSPLLQFLTFSDLGGVIKDFEEIFLKGEFLSLNPLLRKFEKIYCETFTIQLELCENALFIITGYDYRELNHTTFKRLLGHYPAGYSVKGVYLYSQLEKSGKFRRYDYGPAENLRKYGYTEPPDYRVENIRTPLYFYVGKNDYLSTIRDVEKLKSRLSSLRSEYIVDFSKFQHFDFILSKDVKELVYNQIISDMTSFLKNYK